MNKIRPEYKKNVIKGETNKVEIIPPGQKYPKNFMLTGVVKILAPIDALRLSAVFKGANLEIKLRTDFEAINIPASAL